MTSKETLNELNYLIHDSPERVSIEVMEGLKDAVKCIEDMQERIDIMIEGSENKLNHHETACIIADLLGDTCACNFNGNDEWLPKYCDFVKTCCPSPVGVACWEQYLKHLDNKPQECADAENRGGDNS